MSQDLFTNQFGIPPPSDDSYASLSRFIAEFSQAIPQDQFDSFRSKLVSLNEAVISKLRGETLTQDNLSEIRGMLQELREGQNSITERLSGVEGRLSGVEGRLSGVEGRLSGVEGRLSGVEGRLSGVEGRLSGVEGRLSGMEGRFDAFSISFFSHNGEQLSRIRNIEAKTNKTRTSA